MKFIDETKILVSAGAGGDGCVSFRREKYVPRGGPNGGNGGDGGSVILVADAGLATLLDLQYKKNFKADRGVHGMGKDMHGRRGKDCIVRVPTGTIVKDAESGRILADLTKSGETYLAAQGGRGGRGNLAFVSSRNRAPRQAEDGKPGEERTLILELKLLADVGLIGRPNAGKSTLISRISRARPKIADYPFTTLTPNLGVVSSEGFSSFTVADIPGLIEGAHEGAGMGIRFLKHIERTSIFVHLIDLSDPEHADPWESYRRIDEELNAYSKKFKKRKRWVAFTKIDLLADRKGLKKAQALFTKKKIRNFALSSATGEGVQEFVKALGKEVQSLRDGAEPGSPGLTPPD